MSVAQHILGVLRNTIKLGLCAHLFHQHLYELRFTTGPSMLPTLHVAGDVAVLSKLHARGRGVKVGDLASFRIPTFPGVSAIKRVIGMPGDFVLVEPTGPRSDKMIQVPEGHCWVVGDNLGSSRDSRFYGPVPLALIRAKVVSVVHMHGLPRTQKIPDPLHPPDGPWP